MLEEELAEAQGVAEDWRQRVQQLEETMQDLKHELSEARARSAASRETVLEHEASKLRCD
jgi:chromosome segregation ATPase